MNAIIAAILNVTVHEASPKPKQPENQPLSFSRLASGRQSFYYQRGWTAGLSIILPPKQPSLKAPGYRPAA
jgi:hypothetical protein